MMKGGQYNQRNPPIQLVYANKMFKMNKRLILLSFEHLPLKVTITEWKKKTQKVSKLV
jgi:hypothetical protein